MLHTYQTPLVGDRVGVVFGSFAPLHQGHLMLVNHNGGSGQPLPPVPHMI